MRSFCSLSSKSGPFAASVAAVFVLTAPAQAQTNLFSETVSVAAGNASQRSTDPTQPAISASGSESFPGGSDSGLSRITQIGVFNGNASADLSPPSMFPESRDSVNGTYQDIWQLRYVGADPHPGPARITLGEAVSVDLSNSGSTPSSVASSDFSGNFNLSDQGNAYHEYLFDGPNGTSSDTGGITLTLQPGEEFDVSYQWMAQAEDLIVNGAVPSGPLTSRVDYSGLVGFIAPADYVVYSVGQSTGGVGNPLGIPLSSLPPVPEASTTVSFGLLLALGAGGLVVAARRRKGAPSL